jgi:hypothetical protein
MISTVSFSFDLTSSPPRCVVVDSTDYSTLGIPLDVFNAKGYGVLTFNGDEIEAKDTAGNPLINLAVNQNPGYLDLPLDLNENVANGVYNFEYSLRLDSGGPSGPSIPGDVTGGNTFTAPYTFLADFLTAGSSISINGVNNTVASTEIVGPNAVITLSNSTSNGTNLPLRFNDDVSLQFSETYTYSGCTQTTADVDFTYDCEYGNSGTWAVSNATVLGSNEIVSSLSCTINYPSWTNIDPIFNPQVVTTTLPYSPPASTEPVLATGTYSVLLTEQIQQTQTSGLVVTYNKSVTKEFTVSCAGTLCGLVPCIENLRAAHAAELVRNRISKYQVFVDNVLLYYTEAMNYRACGELDKYKETISLLQAQLDASGCECACCDNETYYWVSNNSANSIIDELLANFQYRLFTGTGDPGDTQAGVEFGAIWQNTSTGILYRCTIATPGGLVWEVYYDPNEIINASDVAATATAPLTALDVQGQLDEIATSAVFSAANGLSISSGDVVLGGSLDNATTIDLNSNNLTLSGTTGNVIVSSTIGTAIDVTGTTNALSLTGTSIALDVTATTNTAAILKVDRTTNNTVATNLVLQTTVDSGVGDVGIGSSIQFKSEGASSTITTAAIESPVTNASTQRGTLEFKVKAGAATPVTSLTLNDDLSATLNNYGTGAYTGTVDYLLGVDSSGNIIETPKVEPIVYAAKITKTNPVTFVLTPAINTTGGTLTLAYSGATTSYTLTSSNGAFTTGKTFVFCTLQTGTKASFGVFEGTPSLLLLQTVSDTFPSGYDALENAFIKIEIYP